jgi:N-acetylglutamate synthase-like GNAT family acetyltransferase
MRVQNPNAAPFSIRKARNGDWKGILDCLAAAFAPVRDAYTPEAFLDTILTSDSVKRRLQDMVLFVAVQHYGNVIGTIGCKVVDAAEGHLRGMSVRAECQGSCVSAELLSHAERSFEMLDA